MGAGASESYWWPVSVVSLTPWLIVMLLAWKCFTAQVLVSCVASSIGSLLFQHAMTETGHSTLCVCGGGDCVLLLAFPQTH